MIKKKIYIQNLSQQEKIYLVVGLADFWRGNILLLLFSGHLDSHTTNDVKPNMLLGVQTGKRIPHDEYNVRGVACIH